MRGSWGVAPLFYRFSTTAAAIAAAAEAGLGKPTGPQGPLRTRIAAAITRPTMARTPPVRVDVRAPAPTAAAPRIPITKPASMVIGTARHPTRASRSRRMATAGGYSEATDTGPWLREEENDTLDRRADARGLRGLNARSGAGDTVTVRYGP